MTARLPPSFRCTTLNDGGSLAVNHLYMATIEGRSVTADSDTVKVLVRGGYTIR